MSALITLTCANCATEFQRYRSSIKPGSTPYCSRPCRAIGVGKSQRGSKRTFSAEPMATLNCTCCGVEFQRYRSLLKSTTDRYFCSTECQRQEGSRPRIGNTRDCAKCGNSFYAKPGEQARRFCSVPCANASRQVTYRGTCAYCKAETTWSSPSQAKAYCSKTCAAQARSVKAVQRREVRDCETCGDPFTVSTKNKGQRFCSRACIADRMAVEMVTTPCEFCDTAIRHRISESRRYCSRTCTEAAATANAQGSVGDDGYRVIRVDGKSFLEHRHVMAEQLGHPLPAGTTVHHRNGDKLDNRPENLELWASRHPKGQRVLDLIEHAEWVLATFGADRERLRELDAQAARLSDV